jgi:hypothetical protein
MDSRQYAILVLATFISTLALAYGETSGKHGFHINVSDVSDVYRLFFMLVN